MIVFVGAVVVGATGAFFSDTETSTGNTFTAGAIDLQIDNESYVTNDAGVLVASPNTSWSLGDLSDLGTNGGPELAKLFFNFEDLKPGDIGEDTISLHVNNNDAYLCAAANVTVNSDETCTEPEQTDENGACVVEDDGTEGELAQAINFAFWEDDGDNVLENDETPFLAGPISDLGGSGKIALADSIGGVLGTGPVVGGSDVYIGKAWCFGTLTPAEKGQDGLGKSGTSQNPTSIQNGPLFRDGTGFSCSGADVIDNKSQTDKVVGALEFFAVQSRNNAEFTCAANYTPNWN